MPNAPDGICGTYYQASAEWPSPRSASACGYSYPRRADRTRSRRVACMRTLLDRATAVGGTRDRRRATGMAGRRCARAGCAPFGRRMERCTPCRLWGGGGVCVYCKCGTGIRERGHGASYATRMLMPPPVPVTQPS